MEEILQVKSEIEALGRKAIIVPTDVADVTQVRAMIDKAVESFGRIDILVNNAGWTATTDALDVTEEEYDKTMDASLKSVFFCCRSRGQSDDSAGGRAHHQYRIELRRDCVQEEVGLCRSQGGCITCRELSLEWAHAGVLVNVVAPCITETASRKNIPSVLAIKSGATEQMIPRGQVNQPEDLVGAVLFLSSGLSDMVVGHTLMVDGGWTIH